MIEVLFLAVLSLFEMRVENLCIVHPISIRSAREIYSTDRSGFPAAVLSSDIHHSDVEHVKGFGMQIKKKKYHIA